MSYVCPEGQHAFIHTNSLKRQHELENLLQFAQAQNKLFLSA